MQRQLDFARSLDPDYPAFHPLTPFPGTRVYDEAKAKGWLEITDFDYFDLATPVMRSETMTRAEIEQAIIRLNRSFVSLRWLLRGLFSRHRYRRGMYIWWLLITTKIFVASLFGFKNPLTGTRYTRLVTPRWYH
jgi:anaerobic magnesium-protoporphyrin IX monomethyl ester cyclase